MLGVLDPSPPITNMGFLCTYLIKFYDNIGGGIIIQLYNDYSNTKYQVIITNCSFQENLNTFGSGIGIDIEQFNTLPSMSGLEVLIQNLKLTNNSHVKPEQVLI